MSTGVRSLVPPPPTPKSVCAFYFHCYRFKIIPPTFKLGACRQVDHRRSHRGSQRHAACCRNCTRNRDRKRRWRHGKRRADPHHRCQSQRRYARLPARSPVRLIPYTVPSANIAYDSANAGAADQAFATEQLLTVGQITSTASSRALLAFDLSALPANAVITSASLVLTRLNGNSSGAQMSVRSASVGRPLVATSVDWNNDNGYNSVVLDSLTIDPSAARLAAMLSSLILLSPALFSRLIITVPFSI